MKYWKQLNDWCDRHEGWTVTIGMAVLFGFLMFMSVEYSRAVERLCK